MPTEQIISQKQTLKKKKRITNLLCFILFFLFENVSQINELFHSLNLSIQVLQVHPARTAVGLQKKAKPLTNCFIVHLGSKKEKQ